MRILHIVAGLPPGGGISESVPALCRHLRRLGHEVTLATLDGPLSEAALLAARDGVRLLRFAPSRPRALYYSAAMLRGVASLAAEADVVHVHSNWTFPVWWAGRCALKAGKPLVMSPRGCLDPVRLRHSAWKKRLVGWLDRFFLRRAAVIHATCQAEAEGVREFLKCESSKVLKSEEGGCERAGGERRTSNIERRTSNGRGQERAYPQIVVVPNGVEVGSALVHYCDSALVEDRRSEIGGQRAEDNGTLEPVSITNELMNSRTNELPRLAVRTRSVLYLGRLHPLKGLDLLIDAWAEVRSSKVLKCERSKVGELGAEIGNQQSAISKAAARGAGTNDGVTRTPNIEQRTPNAEVMDEGTGSHRDTEGTENEVSGQRTDAGVVGAARCQDDGIELLSQAEGRLNLVEPGRRPIEPDSLTSERMNSRTNTLPFWQLVIAGPDEQGTLARLIAQAESRGLVVSSKPLAVNSDMMTEKQRLTADGSPFTTEADIVVTGPLYGDEKARVMAAADLFVLPTRSENFGIVVAEALACGVPVICTKGAPWAELLGETEDGGRRTEVGERMARNGERRTSNIERSTSNGRGEVLTCESDNLRGNEAIGNRQPATGEEKGSHRGTERAEDGGRRTEGGGSTANGSSDQVSPNSLTAFSLTASPGRCGWWVDIGEEPLAEALREAMRLTDEERRALGESGRRLVEAKYRWETVAGEMAAVYSGIVNRKP